MYGSIDLIFQADLTICQSIHNLQNTYVDLYICNSNFPRVYFFLRRQERFNYFGKNRSVMLSHENS